MTLFFLFLSSISRECNLFQSIAPKSSEEAQIEDVKVAVRQRDWARACEVTKSFVDAGHPASANLQKRVADGLLSVLFEDDDFFNCVVLGSCGSTNMVCVLAELNTSSACEDSNCLSVLNDCNDIISQSNYASVANSIPGFTCSSALITCSRLPQYQGQTAANATISQLLIDCKQALYAVRNNCPQFASTYVGGPCNTLLNGGGPPCTADICNVTDLGGGTAGCNGAGGGLTTSNYSSDATFVFMSNQTGCD